MRVLLVLAFAAGAAVYSAAALLSYREEVNARKSPRSPPTEAFFHPEANLRVVREALETDDYSDRLLLHLERSLEEAPSFYQPPLLMAAFYANRLERPETVRAGFEAALARFPSNGRLHLTFSEWLLTPRATEPYRAFRDPGDDSTRAAARAVALQHLESGVRLEPDLTRQGLGLLLRFRVPVSEWAGRLPRTDETMNLVLETMDRGPRDDEMRRRLLRDFLSRGSTLALYRSIAYYGEKWGEADLAFEAATRWREAASESNVGSELARATVAVVRHHLAENDGERAYELLRTTIAFMEERELPTESTLELLCSLGEEYLNRRHTAMAQGLFSEAVAVSRFHVPAHLGLARTYRSTGELEASRLALGRVLELDPSNRQARQQLDDLTKLLLAPSRR